MDTRLGLALPLSGPEDLSPSDTPVTQGTLQMDTWLGLALPLSSPEDLSPSDTPGHTAFIPRVALTA